MYEDLYQRQKTANSYSEHTTAVTLSTFENWTKQWLEIVIDRYQVEHPVWIVPASFCAMRYINEGLCFAGDVA